MISGEVAVKGVECRLRALQGPSQHDILGVVVQDGLGETIEGMEAVQMALDECLGPNVVGELGVGLAGIAQHHGEAVEVNVLSVDILTTQVDPVDLGLFAWFGFESDLCPNGPVLLDGQDEVLYNSVSAVVTHRPDLSQDPPG